MRQANVARRLTADKQPWPIQLDPPSPAASVHNFEVVHVTPSPRPNLPNTAYRGGKFSTCPPNAGQVENLPPRRCCRISHVGSNHRPIRHDRSARNDYDALAD